MTAVRMDLTHKDWRERIDKIWSMYQGCRLCPRHCGAHRLQGEYGRCLCGQDALVAKSCLHRGEEPVLSGHRGAGTVFFASCHLHCVYCQNHQISHLGPSRSRHGADRILFEASAVAQHKAAEFSTSIERLAQIFLDLQAKGAHNIELVSPTPHLGPIVDALALATRQGLELPLVYNCSGYEDVETLSALHGIIDIYLPDAKYATRASAAKLSAAPDYPNIVRKALQTMWSQVGPLVVDDEGIAIKGLIVRHMVLPGRFFETDKVLANIAKDLGSAVSMSLMAQYYPAHIAGKIRDLDRSISAAEYDRAFTALEDNDLLEGFAQDLDANACYRPDFSQQGHPFETTSDNSNKSS